MAHKLINDSEKKQRTHMQEKYIGRSNSKVISKYAKVPFHLHLLYVGNYFCMGIVYCSFKFIFLQENLKNNFLH